MTAVTLRRMHRGLMTSARGLTSWPESMAAHMHMVQYLFVDILLLTRGCSGTVQGAYMILLPYYLVCMTPLELHVFFNLWDIIMKLI